MKNIKKKNMNLIIFNPDFSLVFESVCQNASLLEIDRLNHWKLVQFIAARIVF